MAQSTVAKTIGDGTITFYDLADANSFTLIYESGDFSLSVPERPILDIYDRNEFMSPRFGRKSKLTGSFSCVLTDIVDAGYVTPSDLFLRSGAVSGWTSRYGANAEVMAYKIVWTIEGTNHGDTADHVLTVDNCVITDYSPSEGEPNTISFSFESRPAVGANHAISAT